MVDARLRRLPASPAHCSLMLSARSLATTGQSRFTWEQLKGVIGSKLEQVCAEYDVLEPVMADFEEPGYVPPNSAKPWVKA